MVPESCRALFESAGWSPGRRVDVPYDRLRSLGSFSQADAILREFAGLRVGISGLGRECAASDIEFYAHPSADHRYAVAELEPIGSDLFPLGAAHNRHMELFIDVAGRVFAYNVPNRKLWCVGSTFAEAVERLLLGISRYA